MNKNLIGVGARDKIESRKVQNLLTLSRTGRGKKTFPLTCFVPVTSPNEELIPQNFLTFNFDPSLFKIDVKFSNHT